MVSGYPTTGEAGTAFSTMKFASISEVLEKVSALSQPDEDTVAQVRDHQLQLTKPPGSLGRLEELVEFLAGWQRRAVPRLDRVQALVFAGKSRHLCAGRKTLIRRASRRRW